MYMYIYRVDFRLISLFQLPDDCCFEKISMKPLGRRLNSMN